MNIARYLSKQEVAYDLIPHRNTYDAQHLAAVLHEPGKNVAKTVLLRADHGFAYLVAVLPASHRLNLKMAGQAIGGSFLELAHEEEAFQRPPWAGREVSGEYRFFNVALIENPFKNWTT